MQNIHCFAKKPHSEVQNDILYLVNAIVETQ